MSFLKQIQVHLALILATCPLLGVGMRAEYSAVVSSVGSNIAIFFDGSGNNMNAESECDPKKPTWCHTNIARMYNIVKTSEKRTWYEAGVGSDPSDSFALGIGIRSHMENAYNWLVDQVHSEHDKVFVFGYSRGTLSGRMLQGMIQNVGIAKKGYESQAIRTHFDDDEGVARVFKNTEYKSWGKDVKVHFMGLFDPVLRTTLFHSKSKLRSFHLEMTAAVNHLYSALALSEVREIFDANEIAVAPTTKGQQVWFMGMHWDVGGGAPNTEIANINGGWMLDKAHEHGLHLPKGWEGDMKIDPLGDVNTDTALDNYRMKIEEKFKLLKIRNPAFCREERGLSAEGMKILYHKSVEDRMQKIRGWVPLANCCENIHVEDYGPHFVTNPHYEKSFNRKTMHPQRQWAKVEIRGLDSFPVSSKRSSKSTWVIRVASWHSQRKIPIETGIEENSTGVATVRSSEKAILDSMYDPTVKVPTVAVADFKAELVIPYQDSWADTLLIEVEEQKSWGRKNKALMWIPFAAHGKDHEMAKRALKRSSKSGETEDAGTLEVGVEYLHHDREAEEILGGSPAACAWMDLHSGFSRKQMCITENTHRLSINFTRRAGLRSANDCSGFRQDINRQKGIGLRRLED